MKDLLLYVADADAQAFMRSILGKHQALATRPFEFHIERHPQRDAGMVGSGADLARLWKDQYRKALLIWDYHGSGRDHRQAPSEVRAEVQGRLDVVSWRDNSSVTILVPELERWVWCCESALLRHYGLSADQLSAWLEAYATKARSTVDQLKAQEPKELFEFVVRERIRRTISPRDFEAIGKLAGISALMEAEEFRELVETLRRWFPQ